MIAPVFQMMDSTSAPRSLATVGNPTMMILVSMLAIKGPMVVTLRAIHLSCMRRSAGFRGNEDDILSSSTLGLSERIVIFAAVASYWGK
jgi:hypothetical protein